MYQQSAITMKALAGVCMLALSIGRIHARTSPVHQPDSGIFPDCGPGSVYDGKEATCVQVCGDVIQVLCLPVREYCDEQTGRCADCNPLCQDLLSNDTHACLEFCHGNDTYATPRDETSHVTSSYDKPRQVARGHRIGAYFPLGVMVFVVTTCVLWLICYFACNLSKAKRDGEVDGCCFTYAPVPFTRMETA